MKVSVIIPVFNTPEEMLKKSIGSVLNQSYKDWELILVNDQSDEITTNVLNDFLSEKVKVLNTKDINQKGISAALNLGISHATGDLIARLDADDIMIQERLEKQAVLFEQYPELNLCASNAHIINEQDKLYDRQLASTKNLSQLSEQCCIIHPSVMWRKSYFDTNNLTYNSEFDYAEDYDLWLRFMKTEKPVYHCIQENLIGYRVGDYERSSVVHKAEQKEKTRKLYKIHNIAPLISVIYIGDKNAKKESLESIDAGSFNNFEVVKSITEAKGRYIALSKYKNEPQRLQTQFDILENHKTVIGIGSYIKQDSGVFFYPTSPAEIEQEIFKGHLPIEPGTLMFRNMFEIDVLDDYFALYNYFIQHGDLLNVNQPLVVTPAYKYVETTGLTERKKKAKNMYADIRNVVQLNLTSEGNFSGVDRYLQTLRENMPNNIKYQQITFIAGKQFGIIRRDNNHIISYNVNSTQLENLYDIFWDNFKDLFLDKRNLIVQSNCLNLYSLITYIRRKANCKHICAMHCVPFREVIKIDRKKYEDINKLYYDDAVDFNEPDSHTLPLKLADYVILNTKDAESYYNRLGHTVPYSIISNGVEKIKKYEGQKDKFKFIFVGHSSILKGMDQLIPVIESVYEKHKDFEVVWVGQSSDVHKKMIAEKKLPIISLGVVDPKKLNLIYGQVDASLIATACETCSFAALEALSAELPIISTKAPGVNEILDGTAEMIDIDQSGIFNAKQYEKAIIKVLTDENARIEMAKKSAERYKDFTVEKLIKETVEVYNNLWN